MAEPTVPVREASPGNQVAVRGVLAAVRRPPASGTRLVARLYDETGDIDLVWLGRREIPGIEPGRRLLAAGRVSAGPAILNPRYQLLSEDLS